MVLDQIFSNSLWRALVTCRLGYNHFCDRSTGKTVDCTGMRCISMRSQVGTFMVRSGDWAKTEAQGQFGAKKDPERLYRF